MRSKRRPQRGLSVRPSREYDYGKGTEAKEKYAAIKEQLEGKGFQVCCDSFIVCSLGTWDPENNHLLHEIGIGRKYGTLFKTLCCRDAIAGSYRVWTARSSLHAGRASN